MPQLLSGELVLASAGGALGLALVYAGVRLYDADFLLRSSPTASL